MKWSYSKWTIEFFFTKCWRQLCEMLSHSHFVHHLAALHFNMSSLLTELALKDLMIKRCIAAVHLEGRVEQSATPCRLSQLQSHSLKPESLFQFCFERHWEVAQG